MPRTDLLRVLRHRWATILICTLLAGVVVLGATALAEPRYTSTTTLQFSIRLGNTPTELNQGRAYTQSQMSSFAALATSPVVLNQVIDDLELETSAARLAQQISATVPTETVLLDISVSSADRDEAADIANAVGAEVGDYATETAPSSGGRDLLRVESLRTAAPAAQASSPRPRRDVTAGVLAGLFLGLLLAVFREQKHQLVRSTADLKEASGLPVLATLPGRSGRLRRATDEVVTDAHRRMRLGLDDRMQGSPAALVVAAVSWHGDVDEVVRGVATAYAETGAKVVHVDTQAGPGDAGRLPGLPDVLSGETPLVGALVSVSEGYWVLPAGAPVPVLSSSGARATLEQLKRSFDVVLVSCSDVRSNADAAVLARTAGPLLLVAVLGADQVSEVRSAVDDLRAVGVPLLGVVMVDPQLARRRRRQLRPAGAPRTVVTGAVPDSAEPVRWPSGQPEAAVSERRRA